MKITKFLLPLLLLSSLALAKDKSFKEKLLTDADLELTASYGGMNTVSFLNYLALGAGYQRDLEKLTKIKNFGLELSSIYAVSYSDGASLSLFAINGLATYTYPFNEDMDIVGKLGLGFDKATSKFNSFSVSDSELKFQWGTAYHYHLTKTAKLGFLYYSNYYGFSYSFKL